MEREYIIAVLVLVIMVLVVVVVLEILSQYKSRSGIRPTMYFIKDPKYITKELSGILDNLGLYFKDGVPDSSIRFLSGYDDGETELLNIKDNEYNCIFGIKGMDCLAGKNNLWMILKEYYGDAVSGFTPKGYILNDSLPDLSRLLKKGVFVCKKNIQRQEGILLLRGQDLDSEKIKNLKNEGYVIIQEYLQDPFLVNGLKINIRVYLLIVIKNGVCSAYTYNDGFIYYAMKKYNKDSIEPSVCITGGLQKDRSVYKSNPLTIKDLYKITGSSKLQGGIRNLLTKVVAGTQRYLSGHSGATNFQLFGCDIQPDKNLNMKLIEINKSPSLDPKDPRDAQLKYNLQKDIFSVLGISQRKHEFHKLN